MAGRNTTALHNQEMNLGAFKLFGRMCQASKSHWIEQTPSFRLVSRCVCATLEISGSESLIVLDTLCEVFRASLPQTAARYDSNANQNSEVEDQTDKHRAETRNKAPSRRELQRMILFQFIITFFLHIL